MNKERLFENDITYHELFEHVSDCIFLLHVTPDQHFQYVSLNPATEAALGLKASDVRGKYFEEILPLEVAEKFSASCRQCIESGTLVNIEEDIVFPIGFRSLYTTLIPIRNSAKQTHRIIGIARNITEIKKQAKHIQNTLEEALQAICSLVEQRDAYTAGHQQRVANLAEAIVKKLISDPERIHWIYLAAIVHDIGKIQVPIEILTKPTKLTPAEIMLIRMHPEVGYNVLNNIDFSHPLSEIVYQHHEFLDGSGYPRGLRGDDILLESRILTVADIVEAMSSYRPYRPALGVDKALEYIQSIRGVKLDAMVVDACVELFQKDGYQLTHMAAKKNLDRVDLE